MFRIKDPAQLNDSINNTLLNRLGIKVSEIGEDFISAKMPVGPHVHQPMGYLHGGASLALAESVGSIASYLMVDPLKFSVFGLAINANHLKSKRSGVVTAIARPIHIGNTTHVWEIKVIDEKDDLISIVRLTNKIVNARR
jgi:uncharacterized protein (TIGR00369 family)